MFSAARALHLLTFTGKWQVPRGDPAHKKPEPGGGENVFVALEEQRRVSVSCSNRCTCYALESCLDKSRNTLMQTRHHCRRGEQRAMDPRQSEGCSSHFGIVAGDCMRHGFSWGYFRNLSAVRRLCTRSGAATQSCPRSSKISRGLSPAACMVWCVVRESRCGRRPHITRTCKKESRAAGTGPT